MLHLGSLILLDVQRKLERHLLIGPRTDPQRHGGRDHLEIEEGMRARRGDLVALGLANRCNANLVMVQFWFDAATRRFMGQYVLGCRDGIDRRLFIRSLRQFADIFAIAARDYDEDDALCERLDDPEGALD